MFNLFQLDEGPIERTKTRVFLCILGLSLFGELALFLIDLSAGSDFLNNLVMLALISSAVVALAYRKKTLAVYLVLLPFAADFTRSFFENGIGTHALPLLFLLIVEAVYLLPTAHALVFATTMIVLLNAGAYYGPPVDGSGKILVVANAVMVGITLIFTTVFFSLKRYFAELEHQNAHLDDLVHERTRQLDDERRRAEDLLLNILPQSVAERMKKDDRNLVDDIPQASVLFADIAGFTELSKAVPANRLVELLNDVFTAIDELVEHHGLEKIKTIGDAYMVAGGVPDPSPGNTERLAEFALALSDMFHRKADQEGLPLRLRIGMNVGPVVAGIIGSKKFMYDLWGETVNLASRMESAGEPGRIQVSGAVRRELEGKFRFSHRGPVDIRGVGQIDTWFLDSRICPQQAAA